MCHTKLFLENNLLKKWHSQLWSSKSAHCLKFDHTLMFKLSDTLRIDEQVLEREFSNHEKFTYNGVQYCTEESCKKLGYDDSFVNLGIDFFRIENVLVDRNDELYIIGKKLITMPIYNNMFSYKNSNEYHLKKVTCSIRSCVSVSIPKDKANVNYISICKPNTQIN